MLLLTFDGRKPLQISKRFTKVVYYFWLKEEGKLMTVLKEKVREFAEGKNTGGSEDGVAGRGRN